MLSKEEIRIWEIWQFYDKYRMFPFEKEIISITLSKELILKLINIKNKSQFIEETLEKELKHG